MMSKTRWFILLIVFIIYLLLGAGIFFTIETEAESQRIEKEKNEIEQLELLIDELITKTAPSEKIDQLYKKLTNHCGKPIKPGMSLIPNKHKWDFYHSLFFVITVVSTIGYGNLAPTTMFGRIFMIFYGLIGIPLNGIVMVTLGGFFGKSFTNLYKRWKTSNMEADTTRLGLISQIILYAVPGFTFFIFLPSGIMVVLEGWAYDVAVYYCFVTLTTIGFGDYVAGVENVNNFTPFSHWIYKIFLLIWVIGGLGYVVMILSFITKALQSKKMQKIEQIISQNIKKTPLKIRQELRLLLQEFLFSRFKPVYTQGTISIAPHLLDRRTQSCPDLMTLHGNMNLPSMARQRALSECPRNFILNRMQSDTELQNIDINRTFVVNSNDDFEKNKALLMDIVDALSVETEIIEDNENQFAYNGFTDSQILDSEKNNSQWSLNSNNAINNVSKLSAAQRRRAVSDIRDPSALYHYQKNSHKRSRTFSEPNSENGESRSNNNSGNFLTRIKNKLLPQSSRDNLDVERQQYTNKSLKDRRFSTYTSTEDYLQRTRRGRPSVLSEQQQEAVLEQTSLADFLRALHVITVPETLQAEVMPRRKFGTASLSPPKKESPPRTRRMGIRPNLNPQARRSSLIPDTPSTLTDRRFSLRPVEENISFAPPPPYSAVNNESFQGNNNNRRYSRMVPSITVNSGPVQRQVNKKDPKDDSVI